MTAIAKLADGSPRRLGAMLLAMALWLCLCGLASAAPAGELEVFVRAGCPRCEEAEGFLSRLRRERPELQMSIRDVRQEPAAAARLHDLAAQAGVPAVGVPAFHLGGELIVGFDGEATTGARIRALLDGRAAAPALEGAADAGCAIETAATCQPEPVAVDATIELPWLGTRVGVDDLGLPLFTVVIGLLDGFNPCSMWVLVMTVSMLATLRDRRKMLSVAGTFVAVQGVAYFAFMAAWLNLFLLVGMSRASEVVLGILALGAGLINVKDFHAPGRGITLSIPAAAKPGIYARMRSLLHERSLPLAIAGAVALAVLVQIVELLCTSGFPALYTRILTLRGFEPWTYYGYLLLYNAMYMLDDIVVLAIGVVTLSQHRLQEKEGRRLKLLSGVVMLALGAYLILVRR